MKRKRGWLFYPLIIVALLLCALPAYADIPTMPHAFYGTLTVGGSSAAVGTVVTAKVGGVECGSITTTVEGQYGGSGAFDAKLAVTGEIATGATISFYVGGSEANETANFSSGGVTELNLTTEPPVGDTTPPLVTITALTPDPTNDNTPTFTGTATDTESNISSVEYKVDAGSWTAATASDGTFDSLSEGYTFTTSALSDGAHTVYVRATDAATIPNTTVEANYATDSFTVDTAAPSVTITALTPDPWTSNNTPTFTGTATDTLTNISSVEYKVDDGSWTAASASDGTFDSLSEGYTFTTAALSEGAHTVYVRATDSAANTTVEANFASDSFTVATGAPSVSSVSPVNGATDVATYTTVTATFDMAMDEATITTSSFTLDGVSGSVTYDSGTYTATFTPDAKLDSNTTYTATLSTAITSAGGIPLASEYSWSFTTVLVGDATGEGLVDARDITKVERIIAGLDAATPGADATQDGLIDARDITMVERIIAGLE